MLEVLGLKHVATTYIGDNMIRGISGGERKRTSIGVELITNPSMVFLDEPTTGLDSKTSENVVSLLHDLANKGGRTIVCTIHQPSSQIFTQFDDLLLLVRGNIIYQGPTASAIDYFASIGFPCPKLSNPADYFMKVMNESGIMLEALEQTDNKRSLEALNMSPETIEKIFAQRVAKLTASYQNSIMPLQVKKDIVTDSLKDQNKYAASWIKQLWHIFIRKSVDQFRNPMEVRVKIISCIVFALIMVLAFNSVSYIALN